MQFCDVLVVGAGPAGAAAAITAVEAGRRVVVIDKAHFPRDKCCGDGLTTDALRILERLGVRPAEVDGWNAVTDVVVRAPDGRRIELPLPGDGQFAAVAPRADLDHALVRRAVEVGAEVHEGVGFVGLTEHGDRVVVDTTTGERYAARYLVAADGMWSPVRKALGIGADGYRGEWHAFRQYFSSVGPRAQHLVVWFEPDLLPGYAWSFPLPGRRANVGFGIQRGGAHEVGDMGDLWSDLLTRPHVQEVLGPDAVAEDRHKAWPIPARIDDMVAARGRVLLTGDAIAATDPMTGEGIAQALLSGRLAADAITAAGPHRPELARTGYEHALGHHLVTDHRFARSLSQLLRSPRTTDAALRAAALTPWTRRNFARWMFEDYPRALVLTPRRWRRGAMTGPGAYRNGAGRSDETEMAPAVPADTASSTLD
ncbi:MAG: NAD(P)/FAD-dependent oxidoreductase [Acidimicrobiales bacterium]